MSIKKKVKPKTEAALAKERKLVHRLDWKFKLLEKIKQHHKRTIDKVAEKVLKRIETTRAGLMTRSKKYEVECSITLDELRELVYQNYGTKCKYCDKILTINNFVIDHIIPISKNGSSNIDNLQVICKTSNSMKGSLSEEHFLFLLDWLNNVAPEEIRKDVSIRLARGII